jgi:hypothetical protein
MVSEFGGGWMWDVNVDVVQYSTVNNEWFGCGTLIMCDGRAKIRRCKDEARRSLNAPPRAKYSRQLFSLQRIEGLQSAGEANVCEMMLWRGPFYFFRTS